MYESTIMNLNGMTIGNYHHIDLKYFTT